MPYADSKDSVLEDLFREVYDACLEVHRHLGPGMLESAYQAASAHELEGRGLDVETEFSLSVRYKDLVIPQAYRIDILVDGLLPLELKAVEKLLPKHRAQLLTYMRFGDYPLGLLMNFNEKLFRDGAKRLAL